MANIIDNLNILNTNLDNAKFKLAKNLKDKGVQALPSDKLDVLADKIADIPSGSCNLQELDVNENGVYTPQAGDVKGYSKVTVNVPQSEGMFTKKLLLDEFSNSTLPWNNNTLYKPISILLLNPNSQNYTLHHYDSNTSSEVANVDSMGNQATTFWAGEMPEFNNFLLNGYKFSKQYSGIKLTDIEYLNIQQFYFYNPEGETKEILVSQDEFQLVDDYGSTATVTNPVDRASFSNFYALVEPNGYYVRIDNGSQAIDVDCKGANIIFNDGNDKYNIVVEDENTIQFHTSQNINSIRVNFFNAFYNGKYYKNVKCVPNERFLFRKGIKNVNKSVLTSTFEDNYNSSCYAYCDIETVDFNGITGHENIHGVSGWFQGCKKLKSIDFGNEWKTPNLTSMSELFKDCVSLDFNNVKNIDKFDTSKVYHADSCFSGTKIVDASKFASWFTNSFAKMNSMFNSCTELTTVPTIDLTKTENIEYLFYDCYKLNSITFTGDPSKITILTNAFGSEYSHLAENGTLIYDHSYDYTAIINELKKYNPTWTAKADNAA